MKAGKKNNYFPEKLVSNHILQTFLEIKEGEGNITSGHGETLILVHGGISRGGC